MRSPEPVLDSSALSFDLQNRTRAPSARKALDLLVIAPVGGNRLT
jgi:hypothetical protein